MEVMEAMNYLSNSCWIMDTVLRLGGFGYSTPHLGFLLSSSGPFPQLEPSRLLGISNVTTVGSS